MVIRIDFDFNVNVIDVVKTKTSAAWSANPWYIPENNFNPGNFFTALKDTAYIDYRELQKQEQRANKDWPVNEKVYA